VTLCQGDAFAQPFHDESFDRLLAVECIFHFPSREVFFKEAFRVLRPGGVLALSDFVPSPLYLPVAWLTISGRAKTAQVFGHLNVQYTIGRYRRLAKQSGLVPVAQRNITRHTLPTYRYLQRLVEPIAEVSGTVLRTLELLGAIGLMNYYLLSFRKP
jgi:ubiquinone/menaquinone biosynthesis C-methylase UbiE